MKIEKVNDSRLLWSLNKEDFMEYKLNVNDFLYGTKKARTLFQEAMRKAEKDLMFQVEGYLLHCQLQELSASGITFSITRKEQLPKAEENQSDAESVNHTMGTQEDLHLLYEFADLDDVIRVSRLINTQIPFFFSSRRRHTRSSTVSWARQRWLSWLKRSYMAKMFLWMH